MKKPAFVASAGFQRAGGCQSARQGAAICVWPRVHMRAQPAQCPARGAGRERAASDAGVAGDPADVGRAPEPVFRPDL